MFHEPFSGTQPLCHPVGVDPRIPGQTGQRDLCAELTQMAVMGAIIGATGAAGQQLRALQLGERNARQAVRETARVAALSGMATVVAGAAAQAVSSNGMTRLAVLLATGTAVMYAAQGR